MIELLDPAKAASLARVSEKEIQAHITSGELQMVRGKIFLADLSALYPHVQPGDSDMQTRTQRTKEDALTKPGLGEEAQWDTDRLVQEIHRLRDEVRHYQIKAEDFKQLILDLDSLLLALKTHDDKNVRIDSAIQWLRSRIKGLYPGQ